MSATDAPVGATKKLKILGVSGGIGSGKSTACKLLVSDLDCVAHIDADSIAHTVYEPGSQAVADVANEFGTDILKTDESGEIDRKKLGAIVFADRQAMRKLEEIVWPHVQKEIESRIAQYELNWQTDEGSAKKVPVVIVEAAVLLDAEWHNKFLDAVWVVTVPHEVAVQRLIESRSLTREEAEKRIQAQAARRGIGNVEEEIQNKVVTATIDNSDTLEKLKEALSIKLKDETAWYATKPAVS